MANPTLEQVLNTNNAISSLTNSTFQNITSGSAVLEPTIVMSNVPSDGKGCGMPYAWLYLHVDSMAVSAGGAVDGWFVQSQDGSTFAAEDATHIPLRPVDFIFYPWVGTAALDYIAFATPPIVGKFKVLIRNNALGASTPNNTNSFLKFYYFTDSYPTGQT